MRVQITTGNSGNIAILDVRLTLSYCSRPYCSSSARTEILSGTLQEGLHMHIGKKLEIF